MMPRCTVAVPAFNRPELTRRAVASALAQTMDGLEILVVDDASPEPVLDALSGLTDPRLRLVLNPVNLGLFGNFNRCLELASAPCVRILCCDDELAPDCLAAELAAMDRYPDATVLTTRGWFADAAGRDLGPFADLLPPGVYEGRDAVVAALLAHVRYGYNPWNYPSGVLLRREVAFRIGGFKPAFRVAGDVDLFLRMANLGQVIVWPEVGCIVTRHSGQVNQQIAPEAVWLGEMLSISRQVLGPRDRAKYGRQIADFLAGQGLGLAVQFLLRGNPTAAKAHLALRCDSSLPAAVLALAGILGLRFARRFSFSETLDTRSPSRPRTAPN